LYLKIEFMKNNYTRNRVEKINLVMKSGDPAKPTRDNLEKKPMKETPWKKEIIQSRERTPCYHKRNLGGQRYLRWRAKTLS
jgi:hypothetical protein